MATAEIFPVFGQGVGYGIVVGLADLIASSVVSSWTLSATLLTSTTFVYLYGISAVFWYGACCSVPILTFAILTIELKRKAPNAHTFLELVNHRYEAPGNIILVVYSLIYQIFIAVNLLVGGAEVFNIVTGMNKVAVCFLFPISVCIYTHFGGIKATFLNEWVISVGTWLDTAYQIYGIITIATLSEFKPTVIVNMLALTAPIVLTPLITYIHPENYDFEKFKELKQVDDSDLDTADGFVSGMTAVEKTEANVRTSEEYETELLTTRNWAIGTVLFVVISLTVLWPIPMYGSGYIVGKKFFASWIAFTFIWGFFGAIIITCLPLCESRKDICSFFKAIFNDIIGRRERNLREENDIAILNVEPGKHN